jgi:hypothetical protein
MSPKASAETLNSPKSAAAGDADATDTTEDTSQEPADTSSPMCERCRQRKAKARVTMPDGVQSLMCRRCTGEVQRMSSSGKAPRKTKRPSMSPAASAGDNPTL